MLTGDLNVADVKWIVQFRIADPVKYLFHNRSPAEALGDVSQIVMRTIVGDHTVTEVLTERRVEIADLAKTEMQKLLDLYETGLRVTTVKMQNVTPPSEAVKRAFNEVNEAQQEKSRKINEAFMALILELRFSKQAIITAYVNEVFLLQQKRIAVHGFAQASRMMFRRGVESYWNRILLNLYQKGAFKGKTADAAFRIVTDESVNDQRNQELGRFIVEIHIAPSQPTK